MERTSRRSSRPARHLPVRIVPIMVREILEALAPAPGDFAVDVTLGYGGHAASLLQAVLPGGRLLGLDVVSYSATENREPAADARRRRSSADRVSQQFRRLARLM